MSGMIEHPEQLLSEYLDDALAPAELTTVGAHLEGCDRCRGRLAELRATSRLLAALPELAPTRSLRPRVQQGWLWLRPVRLLGSIGSGAFLFLFLASYVINSGSSLGGGTSTSETLAAQGKFGAAASAAAAENAQKAARGAPTPVAAAAPAAATPPAAATQGTTTSNQDSARNVAASPSPGSLSAVATGAATSVDRGPDVRERAYGPPPALFLSLALLCALVAFVAHRRLRRRRS